MLDIEDILGAGGPLARTLPGFAPRREQQHMARCVSEALEALAPLVVEAGTGTGKTFAYLVPALLSGRRVIISTGTRTLQDQLFHRDLPAVAGAIGRPVKTALLKGRANYLCRHRLGLALGAPELALEGANRRDDGRTLGLIERWAQLTRTGDVSEVVDVAENDPVWPAVTSTRENCLGMQCPAFTACHVVAARRAAQAAQVLVVNHHLLLADLALKEEGFGELLPGAQGVILDEAHQVPEIAAQFFGASLGARALASFAREAGAELARTGLAGAEVQRELAALEALVRELRAALPPVSGRLEWHALDSAAIGVFADIEQCLTRAEAAFATLGGDVGIEQCGRRAATLAERCRELRSADEEAGVRWMEARAQHWIVQFTPFEVADRLRQFLDGAACAWIFTSATLAVGEDFSHFTTRVGLPEARTVRIDSPFDYARQALVYLPAGMSDPRAPAHTREVIEAALPLLYAAGGRAFLLFTSHRALQEAKAHLAERLGAEAPFPLLAQGEAPREALLREFRRRGNAVLLGTSSFWEGVDVKGEALSVVVIDKLPFASPEDPVLAARLEGIRRRGGNPFHEYQVPQAVLALKQGVGRLIRDAEDYGVIVLCDPRLATRSYGRVFLRSLPPMEVTTQAEVAARFLQSHVGARARTPQQTQRAAGGAP